MFAITCPRCDGADAACERCKGSGKAMLYRCPRMVVTPEARELLRAYRDLERGFLPADGAMRDQAAGFPRWIGVMDAERAQIEDERASLRRARGRRPITTDGGGD